MKTSKELLERLTQMAEFLFKEGDWPTKVEAAKLLGKVYDQKVWEEADAARKK